MRYNDKIKLNPKQMTLIENGLRALRQEQPDKAQEINQLLAALHDQKTWYRPKGIFVSG